MTQPFANWTRRGDAVPGEDRGRLRGESTSFPYPGEMREEARGLRGEALRVRGAARVAPRGLREAEREPERVEERGMMNSRTAVCALQQSELQCSTRRV